MEMKMRKRNAYCLVFMTIFVFSPVSTCFGEITDFCLTGKWRLYSSRFFYDAGGGGSWDVTASRRLELAQDGRWTYGTSNGTFSIHAIADEDWKRWNIEPYGPAMKIILSGWNGTGGEGPIEESNGGVDVFWVIYRVAPPLVQKPGIVWSKFGR